MDQNLRKSSRYITGLDAQGSSIVLASPDLKYHDRGGYTITRLYQHQKIPINIQDDRDLEYYQSNEEESLIHDEKSSKSFKLVNPAGANFVQGDMGPLSYSAWHRTASVDFVTVVEGDLVLMIGEDDHDCTKIHLKQGVSNFSKKALNISDCLQDSVIQRGSLHKWMNPSNERPARWVATLLACESFKVGDKAAEPIWIPKV
jgi:hypothetical protein